jgi:hypothetical protein
MRGDPKEAQDLERLIDLADAAPEGLVEKARRRLQTLGRPPDPTPPTHRPTIGPT